MIESVKKFDLHEKVIVVRQDHWVVLLKMFQMVIIGTLVALLFLWIADEIRESQLLFSNISAVISFLVFMVVIHVFFIYFLYWELSTWIITNKRIIDYRYLPYMKHDSSFIVISMVHEIEKKKHGVWKNLLNYGDIEVNMAAIEEPSIFHYVPNPTGFIHLVQTIHKSSKPLSLDVKELQKLY